MRKLFGKEATSSIDEKDQMVLAKMRSLGWDMSEERVIESFLYFPTRETAQRAAREVSTLGYDSNVRRGAVENSSSFKQSDAKL